ncbi:helix-turn-helix transcriptional regulator [Bacillus subtilis]|uniref:helix-turn-helix domain-containing protein n=1 Tax=Bacillus subtilis group TaxID=653685 RepID=UPI0011C97DB4|nr:MULTISPECIES: helix-turn-helix transcriptional regulator [Bacillus subtilis group]MDI6657436.1 helix-turn-helix transcriptional regulator [Bacillus subtilis]QHM03379.1 HTH-type transcriptional regulator Xre [Bacillus subtilis]TXK24167.1 helix-turn-helix transcriptional regulator [Bacillus amyloliquefaciens]WGE39829.1 helix-turn-helix transcriptional regulator [Bacillus stercoris]CAF1851531.1 HTH-type transcriptional regulator Xre [Bacillus subtilis]
MESKKIGHAVKRLRTEKKKTVDEAAKEIGISQSYLSRIENNTQVPSLKVIEKIADYFNVHKSYLFFDEESLDSFTDPEKKLLAQQSITVDDLKKLNIVHENGSKITEEELQIVIQHLKELRKLKESYMSDKD